MPTHARKMSEVTTVKYTDEEIRDYLLTLHPGHSIKANYITIGEAYGDTSFQEFTGYTLTKTTTESK